MADDPDYGPVIDVSGPKPLPPGTPYYTSPQGLPGGNPNVAPAPVSSLVADPSSFIPEDTKTVNKNNFVPESTKASSVNKDIYEPKAFAIAKDLGMTDAQAQAFTGVIGHESNFDPNAKGTPDKNTGHQAVGMGQMFPAAMQDAGYKPEDMSDPIKQLQAAGTYFKQKLDKYDGNFDMAAMSYNQGDDPSKWDPSYAVAMRKAAGMPVDATFHQLAGQLYQQQHAAADQSNSSEQPWNYGRNTANNLTLGALTPVQAMIDAQSNGQSYDTEYSLARAWQQKWLSDHPIASMLSDVQGLMIPDTLIGKGVMAGGRALSEAVPAAAKVLTPLLGLTDAYTPLKAGMTSIPRAVAAGAATGVANSGTNPENSVAKDALGGAVGGAVAQPIASAAGYIGQMGSTVGKAMGLVGEPALYDSVRQGLAKTLGTDAPQLTPSQIPGVQYSLPEMLEGKNPEINAKLEDAKTADPIALQQQIAGNNAARVGYYQDLVGRPDDIAELTEQKNKVNRALDTTMNSQPEGENPYGMNMKGVAKYVKDVLNDKSKTPVEGIPEGMEEVKQRLYNPVEKKGKAVASLSDLKDLDQEPTEFEDELENALQDGSGKKVEQKLIDDTRSMHGLRRYLDGQLDKLDAPTTAPQRFLKQELTHIKGMVVDELKKIPGYKEAMAASGELSERIKEKEFLQKKKILNIQDIMNPNALQNMITEIEKSSLYKGLLGNSAKAKSVLPETLEKLKILRDDIRTSLAAKVPVNISNRALEAADEHPLGALFHLSAGTLGAVGGHAMFGAGAGPIGWAGAMIGQQAYRKAAAKTGSRVNRVLLDVLLNPHNHPPIAPKVDSVPRGFYSGMIGGNTVNGLTQASPDDNNLPR